MRIVLVTDWSPTSVGGVQSHVGGLAKWLEKRGAKVYVVSKGSGDLLAEQEGLVEVKPIIPVDTVLAPPNPLKLRDVLEELRPDVVHAHHAFTPLSLLSILAAKSLGICRVLTNHSITIGFEYELLWRTTSYSLLFPYRYVLSKADAIISVSRAADCFISSFADGSVPRYVIPNGVDTEVYSPHQSETQDLRVLFLGRLVYRKGAHVLLLAFKELVEEMREAELVIAGKGVMEPFLRALSSALGLGSRVKIVGGVSKQRKLELLRSAAVVCVPSLFGESFGLVAAEAMACGKPVVATSVGGLPEVVEHGRTGLVVEAGDHVALANALATLLSDTRMLKRMSAEARRVAEERFSWEVVSREVIDVYEEVLEDRWFGEESEAVFNETFHRARLFESLLQTIALMCCREAASTAW